VAEFEIQVTELDAGGKDYVFPIRSAWLAEQLSALGAAGEGLSAPASDGQLSVFADKTGPDVILRGRVQGVVVAPCSRCLKPAPITVDSELALLMTARGRGHRPEPGEEDLSPEEVEREFFTGDTIVLDDVVREHLLVEVPMQPLCSESCPGIHVPESVRGPEDLAAQPSEKSAMAEAFARAARQQSKTKRAN
jgi:uncharacterized protein